MWKFQIYKEEVVAKIEDLFNHDFENAKVLCMLRLQEVWMD